MFKKILLLLCISLTFVSAQNKKFTIKDVVLNSYTSLAPERLNQLQWIPDTRLVSYVEGDSLISVNSNGGEKSTITNLSSINSGLQNINLTEQKRFPRINWIDKNIFSFWNGTNFVQFNIENNSADIVGNTPSHAENQTVAPNNNSIAYTIKNNLFISANGNEQVITEASNNSVVSGQSVSRNEFGINGGIFWSPKSNLLAFYQKDESNVTNYPIVEIGPAPAKLKNIKYPMAGQKSEIVKIGIYDISNDKTIWLDTDDSNEQYLTTVTWDPNEKYIYTAILNRDQNHMKLAKFDSRTGKLIKILFEETDDEYVEPENQLQFICTDDDKFIWLSERDNWQHMYLYNTEGKLIKQLTSGNWEVKEVLGINRDTHEVYFIGTKDSPIADNLYKVKVKTGEITRITSGEGNHRISYNKDQKLFVDNYTSLDEPYVRNIINDDGEVLTTLLKSKNPIEDFEISKPKIFTLKNEDGIELYSRLILPTDFDSTKKYPVVFYVYGGPHAQLIRNSWYFGRYDFWFQYMAQNGYIVFTLDNRGSANRGLEFEQATFRDLGTKEIEDQLVGLNYLKSLDYVDSSRIGVFGWSYGGFMTTSLMLRTNDAFKVGVGGGAVIDWKYYEIMYTERYMDTPETNPEGYEKASLLNYVDNLNGKLLLVHGTSDPVVVWEHTLEFAKKAMNLNKPLDYFPYVGHEHGVRGRDAIHLYEKISNYFFDNL